MEKPVAAIEFGSKKLKLVVGYELEGKVYVYYALTKPYGHIVEAGKVIDQQKLAECIKSVKNFYDPSAKIKISIADALLVLPPYGLEVFDSQQVTTVISDEGKIGNTDIKNIYTLIRNGSLPLVNQLIDVAPERYVLDQDRIFARPPLGESSSALTVKAKIHTLPKRIFGEFKSAMIGGEVAVKRFGVAPFGAAELLATYEDVPTSYLLVDIGSNTTSVSLIGEKQLYSSRFFQWGGDNITDRIVESFNINEYEAEKYKITYGVDKRDMNFRAPICSTDDGSGNEIKHYTTELNEIIKGELEIFVRQLNDAIEQLQDTHDNSYRQLPMILIGGGAKLNGLVEYVEPKVQSETVKVIAPRVLGARNGTFMNCLGLILVNSKYPNLYDETHPRIEGLTRDEKK